MPKFLEYYSNGAKKKKVDNFDLGFAQHWQYQVCLFDKVNNFLPNL